MAINPQSRLSNSLIPCKDGEDHSGLAVATGQQRQYCQSLSADAPPEVFRPSVVDFAAKLTAYARYSATLARGTSCLGSRQC